MNRLLAVALTGALLGLISLASAKCPNNCNGHGTCDKYSRCHCAVTYSGADCSQRTCPFGLAWTDEAVDTDHAHQPAECSNRGLCDRETGKCACMEGFTGGACERLTCPSNCNDKGRCLSMRDFAAKTRNEESVAYKYDSIWDADKLQGCFCDYPASGYDCSQRLCPRGDDPLTLNQKNEVQVLRCTANTGSFVLYYKGRPSAVIPHYAPAHVVQQALLKIPTLNEVKVSFSLPWTNTSVCQLQSNLVLIEFTQEFGPQPPLVAQPDATLRGSGGYIDVNADGATTWLDHLGQAVSSVKGDKENDACSNRGSCDETEGVCTCYETNNDVYGSSNGYGLPGNRGDCGYIVSATTKSVSSCPGEIPCSGHGVCDTDSFRCFCSAGWTGGDCAEKTCPQGRSWFAYPTADNTAHDDYSECANMGLCDRTTGTCLCRPGFYGESCEYMTCGGGETATIDGSPATTGTSVCSGHGRCMTMYELALWAESNGDATDFSYGSDANNPHTWDHDRVHGCRCDSGFTGYDCSRKTCPTGDDPGTYEDHSEAQLLQCTAEAGNFTLSFRQRETRVLQHNVTARELEEALSELSTIGRLSVFFSLDGPLPDGTLNSSPVPPHIAQSVPVPEPQPPAERLTTSAFCRTDGTQIAVLLFTHTHGDLPAIRANTSFLLDFTNGDGGWSSGHIRVFTDGESVAGMQSVRGTTENTACNGRGLCNSDTGLCECFEDWTSSDGARQGGPGDTGDCGYRNDKRFSFFDSVQSSLTATAN